MGEIKQERAFSFIHILPRRLGQGAEAGAADEAGAGDGAGTA